MSIELFLALLFCSTITTIMMTESFKKMLDATGMPYRTNAVALDAAMIWTTLIGVIFKTYLKLGLSLSAIQVTRLILVILRTWILSMFIYDKFVQTVQQYKRYYSLKQADKKLEKNIIKKIKDAINKH